MPRSLTFRRSLLHFEALEDRLAPALFTVTNVSNSGAGSLRQAIVDANAAGGADTIDFSPAVFATQKTITLSSGELSITGSLTITGPAVGVRISGNKASRVFYLQGLSGTTVAMSRLEIVDGTTGGQGGGILADNNDLVLTDCTVAGSSAFGGGGIYVFGDSDLYLNRCTISGNVCPSSFGGGIGFVSSGAFDLLNTTVSNNSAPNAGGGFVSIGPSNIDNSTITGNFSAGAGGGGYFSATSGYCAIRNSIISGNTSGTTAVDLFRSTNAINVNNCAIGVASGFIRNDLGGNLAYGIDLKLGPLADNGGTTKSHMPAFDSPLVNKGNQSFTLTIDQRGTGYPRSLGTKIDIGSVEFLDTVVRNTNDASVGSLRYVVGEANLVAGTETITFLGSVFSTAKTITLTTGAIGITTALNIVGPGSQLLTINGNNIAQPINAGPIANGSTFNLSGMTISNGKNVSFGGGLVVGDAIATLTDVAFKSNSGSLGGGIYMSSATGSLTLNDCTFFDNVAGDEGGGLWFNLGTLTINRCTFEINNAVGAGAGARIGGPAAGSSIRGSTFSANEAGTVGGGLALLNLTSAFTIANTTIVNNLAEDTEGGGIGRVGATGSLSLASTIVSGNSSPSGTDVASPGTVTVNNCAIGTAAGFSPVGTGNLFGATLSLGTLANNGGLTRTHMPGNGSPLVDAGSNPLSLTTDQRGLARTIGANTDIGAVEARAFVVRNTTDSNGGSLRQVLASADALAGADTVTFDPAVFATPQTISIATGIGIGSAVSLIGPGAGLTTLKGVSAFPVVFTTIAPAGTPIAVSGLTLTQGALGVSVEDEALTLADCVVTGNVSLGGIAVAGGYGSLTLDHCAITNNQGGGVRLFGYVYSPAATIRDTVISGNTASKGGGIYLQYAGNLLVERTTIAGNQATAGSGGGILSNNHNSQRFINIRNSTLSGNSTSAAGGGIAIPGGTATVSFENTTIAGNTAMAAGGGIGQAFGAINLTSCIVSGNVNAAAPDISSSGTVTANFSAIGSNAGFTLSGANNLAFGANVKLGPLSNNGGPTPTHALLPGSAAIDAGSNPLSLSSDQRSVGFVRTFGGKADIGSFEVQSVPAKIVSVAINDGSAQRSRVTSLLVTFDQPPQLPGSPTNGFELKRQSDNAIVVLNAVPTSNTVTLTFTGGDVEFGSLADGRYKLTALASQISNLDGDSNGTAGDDFVLVGDTTNKLFRLFGDSDGDGTVAANDFIQFRLALGGTSVIFDFDNDGAVAASDFIQFRLRFGGSI